MSIGLYSPLYSSTCFCTLHSIPLVSVEYTGVRSGAHQRHERVPDRNLNDKRPPCIDGPGPPKMSTYDGKSDWRFCMQFGPTARRYGWSEETKLDRLVESFRDKALKIFSDKPEAIQENYTAMTNKLKRRFGRADEPVTVRRRLQELYQREDERLEEFAERAHELTIDGYPGIDDVTIETIATDAFLKGCREKLH